MSLSESNKIIAINTIILYGRLFVTTIVGLICTRLLLSALGAEELGIFYVVAGFISSINFLNTVLTSASFRFLASELGKGQTGELNKTFNISFIIHLFLAIIFLIVALTFGTYYIHYHLNVPESKVDEAYWVFIFSMIGTFFSILGIPFNGLITAHENFQVRATIEIIRALTRLLIVVVIYLFVKDGLMVYAFLMIFVTVIPPILFFSYCRNKYPTEVKWQLVKDIKEYKPMLNFSGWLFFGASASVLRLQVAALIINAFFGTILNAAFGVANQINHLVTVFANTLSQATIPQITKNYSINKKRSVKLAETISRISFFMILFLSFPILLNTKDLLSIWLTDIPAYTTIFVQLMIINALLESIHSGLPVYINASGNIKWFQIVNGTLLILSLPVSYLLFKNGAKPYFITICYTGAYIISRFTMLFQLKTILKFDVASYIKKVYMPSLLVLLFILPLYFLNQYLNSGLLSLISVSIFSIILTVIGIYLVGINRNERQLVNEYFITFFSKS